MNMKQHLTVLFLIGLTNTALAADKIGGSGIPYSGRLVFQKADTQTTAQTLMVKTGDNITASQQENSKLSSPVIVSAVKSSGWCDPLANPNKTTADIAECYGWSMYSQWFLLDLSAVKSKSVWLQISAKRYDDGEAVEVDAFGNLLPSDDDLIPAVTVWRGQQIQGKFGDWYPNRFQGFDAKGAAQTGFKPFWAWDLTPLNNTESAPSWATAATSNDKSVVTMTQNVKLTGGNNNLFTVAVSGDAQQSGAQHNANFKLLVKLSTKQPTGAPTEPAGGGSEPSGSFDSYGCAIGVTCWHPQMNHCMDIPACNEPQYKGECLCPVK